MTEIEPCPKCGALPCDWTDNPHTAPSGDEVERVARVIHVELTEAIIDQGGHRAIVAVSNNREVASFTNTTSWGAQPNEQTWAEARAFKSGWDEAQAALSAMRPVVDAALAAELAALDAKATPGPWGIYEQTIAASTPARKIANAKAELALQVDLVPQADLAESIYLLAAGDRCPATTGCGPASAVNAALIVTLRNNMPAILAALRQAGEV